MMYLGMLVLIERDFIQNETVLRYLTGHPVSKITIAMFFVGFASLAMISRNVFEQFGAEKKTRFDLRVISPIANGQVNHDASQLASDENSEAIEAEAIAADGSAGESPSDLPFSDSSEPNQEPLSVNSENPVVEQAVVGGQQMLELPTWMQEHYLWKRIVNALHSIYRTGSISNVEDELKYLADLDVERQQQRYSLVRILIWATPMLGFLGTVLGISQALGGISVGPENDFQQMMNGLQGSLYIAFDTTALALTLSMVLMFGQFLVDRFESQLLLLVDQRASSEIARNFDLSEEPATPMEKVSDDILESMRLAVESQTEIWRKTITLAENAWSSSLTQVSDRVQEQLSTALNGSVGDLAHYLGEAIDKADDSMTQRWGQWQVTLSDNARLLANQQMRMVDQTELIQQLLVQTEDTSLFEPALKKNRDAIEQTRLLRESLAKLSQAVEGMATQNHDDGDAQPNQPAERDEASANKEMTNDKTPEKLATIVFPELSNELELPPMVDMAEATFHGAEAVFGSASSTDDSSASSAPSLSSEIDEFGFSENESTPEIVLNDPSEKKPFAPLNGDASTYSEVTFTLPQRHSPHSEETPVSFRRESLASANGANDDSAEQSAETDISKKPLVIFPISKKVA